MSTAAPPPFAHTGRRLGRAVLLFVVAAIAVVTLDPFEFIRPTRLALNGWDGWFDAAANVALFVAPGFLYALSRSAVDSPADDAAARRRTMRRTMRRALWYGALLSAAIEAAQLFEPARYSSLLDVAANAGGAMLGAWLHGRIARVLSAESPLLAALALELPLMGLLYLLMPLCSLAALTLPRGAALADGPLLSAHAYGLLAVALLGGVLLGHVQRWRLGPSGQLRPWQAAVAAALWFALGTIPAIGRSPALVAAGAAAAALVTWGIGALPLAPHERDRRFEIAALRAGGPFFASYLALDALSQPARPSPWLSKVGIVGHVERLAAFTILGYMIAESLGRLELRQRRAALGVALASLLVAVGVSALEHRGVPAPGALGGLAFYAAAGAYGGWIYHLQRSHVRALVAARRARSGADGAPERAAPPAARERPSRAGLVAVPE